MHTYSSPVPRVRERLLGYLEALLWQIYVIFMTTALVVTHTLTHVHQRETQLLSGLARMVWCTPGAGSVSFVVQVQCSPILCRSAPLCWLGLIWCAFPVQIECRFSGPACSSSAGGGDRPPAACRGKIELACHTATASGPGLFWPSRAERSVSTAELQAVS